jgi:hypothetical protein
MPTKEGLLKDDFAATGKKNKKNLDKQGHKN